MTTGEGRHRAGRVRSGQGQAGFTLFEVLVALAVVAAMLAAIGRQVGMSALSARRVEQHAATMAAARLLLATLPRGGSPMPRESRGRIDDHVWQIRVTPFGDGPATPAGAVFTAQRVEMRMRAPSGALLSFETVRLQSRAGR